MWNLCLRCQTTTTTTTIPGLTIVLWTYMFRRTNKRGYSKRIPVWRTWYHEIICRALPISVHARQKKKIELQKLLSGAHTQISTRMWSPPTWKYEFLEKFSIFCFDPKLGPCLYLVIFYLFSSLFCSLKSYLSYFGALTYDICVIKPAVNTH